MMPRRIARVRRERLVMLFVLVDSARDGRDSSLELCCLIRHARRIAVLVAVSVSAREMVFGRVSVGCYEC